MPETWVLAEFDSPEGVLRAARALRDQGERRVDTYSGFPLHGAPRALGLGGSRIPLLALAGGLTGGATGYGFQWFCNAVSFPINVGNRPPHAPLSFVPISFELMVLFAAFAIFFGLLFLARLPQPYHPVFEAEGFSRVGTDRFWLSVTVDGPGEDLLPKLRALGAGQVERVPGEQRP